MLSGKTALITGASRGIGKGIAEVFAKHGANVAFTYSSSVELALAFVAIGRVCYQVYNNAQPEADMMIWISILALMVKVSCLYLISKRRHDGAHLYAMRGDIPGHARVLPRCQ